MNQDQKNQITAMISEKVVIAGSQNAYARSIGVSEAQLSNVTSGKWHKVGDDMWRKLADAVGFKSADWNIVETKNHKVITDLLNDSQEYANTFCLIAPAGSGKTTSTKCHSENNKHSFRIVCSEFWNKKSFLQELLKSMGRNTDDSTTYELMRNIEDYILKCENPIITMDEADKLRDEVFYFFITLYNKLEDKCGLVIAGTEFLKKRILRGYTLNKKGYTEIYSRIGRKFIELQSVGSMDISKICQANGVDNMSDIKTIVDNSDGDIRSVKRGIHKTKRQNKKGGESGATN